MREEDRYWVKVSLTIGFVVLVLLLLLISGMIGNMKHIVINILEAVQKDSSEVRRVHRRLVCLSL